MKNQIKKILLYPLTAVLLLAFTITSCSDVSGPDSQGLNQASVDQFAEAGKNQGINGSALDTNIEDGKQQGKIYVCKFVRTPNNKKGGGEFEELKRGNQGLVHVSPNTVRNVAPSFPTVNIGDFWTDAHTLSVVIDPQEGYDVLSGNSELSAEEICRSYSACRLTENSGIIYGMARNSGEIYEVDVIGRTANLVYTSPTTENYSNTSPNGLAFDSVKDRVYYTNYRIGQNLDRNLYYYDFAADAEFVAGEVGEEVAAADFYNGKYYAMDSGKATTGAITFTDDLLVIDFKDDGTINTIENRTLSNHEHEWAFEGDIAIKDGMLHGWGLCEIHKQDNSNRKAYEYFTYDLSNGDFTWTKNVWQKSLQLSFGSNGVLYGHRSGAAELGSTSVGNFYEVDLTDGLSVSEINSDAPGDDPIIIDPIINSDGSSSSLTFTDTASALQCVR